MNYSLKPLEYRHKNFIVLLHYVFVLLVFFVCDVFLKLYNVIIMSIFRVNGPFCVFLSLELFVVVQRIQTKNLHAIAERLFIFCCSFFFLLLRMLHSLMSAVASETANTHALFVSTIQVMNRDHSEI